MLNLSLGEKWIIYFYKILDLLAQAGSIYTRVQYTKATVYESFHRIMNLSRFVVILNRGYLFACS